VGRPGRCGAGGGGQRQPDIGTVERLHADAARDLGQAQHVDGRQRGGRRGGGARWALRSRQGYRQAEEHGAGQHVVEQVEAGDLNGPQTRALVKEYTGPLLRAGADTIVLGCTHYPFLRPLIQEVVGPDVTLIDTGAAVARHVHRVLSENHLLRRDNRVGAAQFWTSGDAVHGEAVASRLWGSRLTVQPLPVGVG